MSTYMITFTGNVHRRKVYGERNLNSEMTAKVIWNAQTHEHGCFFLNDHLLLKQYF